MEVYNIKKVQRPCVYIFKRRGQTLYIGFSRRGFWRIFSTVGRAEYRRTQARKEADEVYVRWFTNDLAARQAEYRLLVKYRPPYNLHNGHCPLGHPYQVRKDGRICPTCRRLRYLAKHPASKRSPRSDFGSHH